MKDSSEHHRIIVEKGGQRLDVFLKEHFSHLSRSSLQKLIHEGKVTVNKKVEKPSHLLKTGDKIDIIITPLKETVLVPEPLPLDILFEDDYLLVLNKPAGMTTHPVYPGQKGTLVNALLYHTKNLSQMGGLLRPKLRKSIWLWLKANLLMLKELSMLKLEGVLRVGEEWCQMESLPGKL